ncbi:MAG: rhamnogalacturonan acetylesterase [Clostridiales bacterium]
MKKIVNYTISILLIIFSILSFYSSAYAKNDCENVKLSNEYWYFDFGKGSVADGFEKITKADKYTNKTGFGFYGKEIIKSVNQNTGDEIREDYCLSKSNKVYYFKANVPDGTYNITFVAGDKRIKNITYVDILKDKSTDKIKLSSKASEYDQQSITANVKGGIIDLAIKGKLSSIEISKITKFDFGPGEVEPGYTQITADTVYNEDSGYGFLDTSVITEEIRDDLTNLTNDFCTGGDFAFDVDIPKGSYEIIVYSGDSETKSLTSTRAYAEGLLQMVGIGERVGKVGKESYPLNLNDNKMNLRFTGWPGYLNGLEIIKQPESWLDKRPTIFIASDSTVQSYKSYAYPQMGWGQVLAKYLTDDVLIDNHAIGGRSTKSYLEEGSLDTVMSRAEAGDYLLIQFGHNDASSVESRHTDPYDDFKTNLYEFIDIARDSGVTPILITPVGRRSYNSNGLFKNDFSDYCTAIKQVSEEKDVQIIDLMSKSINYYNSVGIEETKDIFLWLEAGEYENFPNGISDNTHFQEYGANEIVKILVNSFIEDKIDELANYVR